MGCVKHFAHWKIKWITIFGVMIFLSILSFAGWGKPISNSNVTEQMVRLSASPDEYLKNIIQSLNSGQLKRAQKIADRLVETFPNFQLGHLIKGDLLLMGVRAVNGFGAGAKVAPEKLQALRDEATARIRSVLLKPSVDVLPRLILQLPKNQKFVYVVDAKRSRLYIYRQEQGALKLIDDYYVSQGKLGINKVKEGDLRTPIGVYYVVEWLHGKKLAPKYGAGAMPINYPNKWDNLKGRSGSGIWLHGTSSESFSRPRLSSDGCIVLSNQDLLRLKSSVELGKTPVIIADQVEFAPREQLERARDDMNKVIESWRVDIENGDSARIFRHYAPQFLSEHGKDEIRLMAQNKGASDKQQEWQRIEDMAIFRYPEQENLIYVNFLQKSGLGTKTHRLVRKEQFWSAENGQWRIVFESMN